MSWVYVPGLAGSSLASALPCPERGASLTWRGKPMPPRTLSRAWKTGAFITRLSGLTLPPSTLEDGVASWIASLRETRASPTVSPDADLAPPTNGFSLIRCCGSSRSAGLIVSSARTCAGTPTGSSAPLSRHWKGWVTALRQEFSARPRPERATGASDCSLWPTAVAQDDNKSPEAHLAMKARMKGGPRNTVTSLQVMAKIWATPQARDHFPAHTPERVEKMKALGHGMRNLNDEVSQWRTPSDISKRGGSQDPAKRKAGGHAVNLEDQAEHWPPPITADDGRKVTPRSAQRQLCNVASVWPQSFARPDQPMPAGGRYSDTRRSLNPLFVEWLMGWPIGWTDCGQPVTGFSRWLQRSRGALSTLCTPMPTAQGDLFGA